MNRVESAGSKIDRLTSSRIFRAGIAAGALFLAGCASAHRAAPPTERVVEQAAPNPNYDFELNANTPEEKSYSIPNSLISFWIDAIDSECDAKIESMFNDDSYCTISEIPSGVAIYENLDTGNEVMKIGFYVVEFIYPYEYESVEEYPISQQNGTWEIDGL